MEIFGLLLVLGLIATLILPWVNLGRISSQRSELEQLRRELSKLQDDSRSEPAVDPRREPAKPHGAAPPNAGEAQPAAEAGPGAAGSVEADVPRRPASVPVEAAVPVSAQPGSAALPSGPAPAPEPDAADRRMAERSAEPAEPAGPQDWFSKIAVWVGGIALLMAGFYMIKYSIDSGWLTPAVRLWLTTGFGAMLCAAGFVIGIKPAMAAHRQIGQSLAGAGIACLYFAPYAAVHLYGFLAPGQGFIAMLAVTVLAVGLSLKNGAPIAMMGLVGGFLTPWLMSTGSNDTVMLFSYLFLLFCGAQFICMRRGWWALLLGSLAGAYLWSAVVIAGYFNGTLHTLEGTLPFILGICVVNAIWAFLAKPDVRKGAAAGWLAAIRLTTWGGGLAQGLILVLIGGFAAVDMVLFSLLSLAALLLAVLREDDFIWAAWLALTAVAASTLSNMDTALWSWLAAPLGLTGLFFVVGHWRSLGSARVLIWRSLSMAAALMVVPLLYVNREWVVGGEVPTGSSAWLWMAAVWAGLLALAGEHILRRSGDLEVAGEYSAFAVFLLGFGLWTYVPADYAAHTAAGLLLGAALYWKRRALGRSLLVVSVLGLAWAAPMWLHAMDACAYFVRQEVDHAPAQDGRAVAAWGLGLVGAITVFRCFRNLWSDAARRGLTWIPGLIGLLGIVAGYQWLDQNHMPAAWAATTVEGGLTALLALAAAGLACLARRWKACHPASAAVAGLAGLRVIVLHLDDRGAEGESFFFNALLLQFGIPFAAACFLAWRSGKAGFERPQRVYQGAAMLLGFVWATFLVQDYYGGSTLLDGDYSSTEIYTYSVVWLLLAVAYQAIGLWRNQSVIHVGSLILLLITIGKVFLVDASELEGLFRVLSFLGLGLALIGIGFFYNRVVFTRRGNGAGGAGSEGHAPQ